MSAQPPSLLPQATVLPPSVLPLPVVDNSAVIASTIASHHELIILPPDTF
jgi:hypothetical protein